MPPFHFIHWLDISTHDRFKVGAAWADGIFCHQLSMTDSNPSFLPRIESVFYAVFDEHQGPKIVHQVPEGLIAGQHSGTSNVVSAVGSHFTTSPTTSTPTPFSSEQDASISRLTASALSSPVLSRVGERPLFPSPQKRGSPRFLFNFDDISKYIIPPSALCGRIVKFATRNHRIIGFPVELKGHYRRNYFRYNLCFVFDRNADLSCYEPIVRKASRVLTACEVSHITHIINYWLIYRRKSLPFCLVRIAQRQYTLYWNSCMRTLTRTRKHLSRLMSSTRLTLRSSPFIPIHRRLKIGKFH